MQTTTLLVPSINVARYKAILEDNAIRYALTTGPELTELTIQSEEETLVKELLDLLTPTEKMELARQVLRETLVQHFATRELVAIECQWQETPNVATRRHVTLASVSHEDGSGYRFNVSAYTEKGKRVRGFLDLFNDAHDVESL